MEDDVTDEERWAALQTDLHAALSEVINRHQEDPAYLMRFVVLAELAESDGERNLLMVAADGMMRWDTLGLLDHARSAEYANANRAT